MKMGNLFKFGSIFAALALAFQVSAETAMKSDKDISSDIKNKLSADTSLSEFTVDVNTNNGLVILTGTVNSDADAGTIIELAQSTPGVKDVDASKMTIKKSERAFDDTVITAKVKGEFIKAKLFGDKMIKPMSIHVDTKGGIVYLTGNAANQQQIDDAVKLAKMVKDVKSVQSDIKLGAM